jgi:hypothetical protein
MGNQDNVHGEGNYAASRQYNDATKKFVESGKVDKAAHDAAPTSDADALQMAAAEAEGRARAKEEDPMLTRKPPKRDRSGESADTPETAPEESRLPKPGEDR